MRKQAVTSAKKEASLFSSNSLERKLNQFWENVNVALPDECWLWQGNEGGGQPHDHYGVLGQVFAHRLSYLIHHGPIPPRHFVLHSCHNRKCVNPAHLRTGTQKENMREAQLAGRMRGIGVPRKLTPDKVRDIRRRLDEGEKQMALAIEYGVSQPTISNIHTGNRLSWLDGEAAEQFMQSEERAVRPNETWYERRQREAAEAAAKAEMEVQNV